MEGGVDVLVVVEDEEHEDHRCGDDDDDDEDNELQIRNSLTLYQEEEVLQIGEHGEPTPIVEDQRHRITKCRQ